MTSFARIFLWTCLILAALISTTIGIAIGAKSLGLTTAWIIILAGIIPALIAIFTTTLIEKKITDQSIAICVSSLGLGKPCPKQLWIGALCLLPILTAYIVMFFGLHTSLKLAPGFPFLLLKLVIAQGIAEEVVFRGFVFRHLRVGRSFWRAALLSASIFSIAHLSHLFKGVSTQILIDMSVSIGFTFVMAPALALLFEYGGNVIWGCSLLHLGFDSINLFAEATSATISLESLIYAIGILGSVLMLFWLGPHLMPAQARTAA